MSFCTTECDLTRTLLRSFWGYTQILQLSSLLSKLEASQCHMRCATSSFQCMQLPLPLLVAPSLPFPCSVLPVLLLIQYSYFTCKLSSNLCSEKLLAGMRLLSERKSNKKNLSCTSSSTHTNIQYIKSTSVHHNFCILGWFGYAFLPGTKTTEMCIAQPRSW